MLCGKKKKNQQNNPFEKEQKKFFVLETPKGIDFFFLFGKIQKNNLFKNENIERLQKNILEKFFKGGIAKW